MPTATASSNIIAPPSAGLANQGWKDSQDAIFHADGRLAEGPIALAEVQGYVYCAKRLAARCAERLGTDATARSSSTPQAEHLAERFDASFWCPEIDTYALALDGSKQPCRVRSSNAGQVLFTGIAKPERAHQGRRRPAAARSSFPAGASARSPIPKRATIRCPITTARSGRTTMR